MVSEEAKTITTINRHIALVQKNLLLICQELQRRANGHDQSKFREDEFSGFVQINKIAREYPYGSKEYKASLKEVDAVDLHYSRNDHHPEHFDGGVSDMDIFQLIEMVCDWKAASESYGRTSFGESLRIQKERFGLDDKQFYVIQLIAEALL